MRLQSTSSILATGAAVLAVAGCGGGGGGGGDDAQGVVSSYLKAIKARNWDTACGEMASATKQTIETLAGRKCARALESALSSGPGAARVRLLSDARVGGASVNGDRGTVDVRIDKLKRTLKIPVVREGGTWKVAQGGVG